MDSNAHNSRFQIPEGKISQILNSTSKNFPDSFTWGEVTDHPVTDLLAYWKSLCSKIIYFIDPLQFDRIFLLHGKAVRDKGGGGGEEGGAAN